MRERDVIVIGEGASGQSSVVSGEMPPETTDDSRLTTAAFDGDGDDGNVLLFAPRARKFWPRAGSFDGGSAA